MLSVSMIVPVWNEAALIEPFVEHALERAPGVEILVVDGGSEDGTLERAAGFAGDRVRLLVASRGRARQMNAGAARAQGDVLWFVHVDSRLPPGCVEAIHHALIGPGVAGGCFRLRISRPEPIYRISDRLGNLGVDLFRIALGDHGIFCRRAAFAAVGGFPDVPLMEDAELYRRLSRLGRVVQVTPEVETSSRRYEAHGPARTTFLYALILSLYALGCSPARLHRLYRRLGR